MSSHPPVIYERDRGEIVGAIGHRIQGYTPQWKPQPESASNTLLEIFSRYIEILTKGVNRVPDRSQLAFLDMLGTRLLPAQSARAPLVFKLMEKSPVDVTLPANTQVAARVEPPPVSPLADTGEKPDQQEDVIFATTQPISLTRAELAAVYSIDPGNDTYADHTDNITTGFTFFEDMKPAVHAFYIGHNELLALSGKARIHLSIRTPPLPVETVRSGLDVKWEYLSEHGWLGLEVSTDGTAGLGQTGEILLEKSCGPDSMEETFNGHKSYWIRARLGKSFPPPTPTDPSRLPSIDTVHIRVFFTRGELLPEAIFNDGFRLDINNTIYPFGRQPEEHTTFHLASKEVFQRRSARIELNFDFAQYGFTGGNAKLKWEYHDGHTWRSLHSGFEFEDGTDDFKQGNRVFFVCPADWNLAIVNGESNYWLRVGIERGDYGKPLKLSVNEEPGNNAPNDEDISNEGISDQGSANNGSIVTSTVEAIPATVEAPIIKKITLQYTYITLPTLPEHALTYNNFTWKDRTYPSQWREQTFEPFTPPDEFDPAVYFGFDRQLPVGLISLYLQISAQGTPEGSAAQVSPFVWEVMTSNGWSELSVLDETNGFQRSGLVQFIGPNDAMGTEGLRHRLYRVRARLKPGEQRQALPIEGLWLNAVWATHRQYVERQVIGRSDGGPHQTFSLPLLNPGGSVLNADIEIREWTGPGNDWETVVQGLTEKEFRKEEDPVRDRVTAIWVSWQERPHLFDSGQEDRHYTLERADGMVRFGDGRYGYLPPAGSQIAATYTHGGGLAGNVSEGTITELRSGVPYLEKVGNPTAAEGGVEEESTQSVRERGHPRIRHRNRAATKSDFEWLAREASPAVARARSLDLRGPAGKAQRGWVTMVIVPATDERFPQPTFELKRRVYEYLAGHCPATVAQRILITGPEYVPVTVVVELVPGHPGDAAKVEARVRRNLDRFLHPLTGGVNNNGWRFGQPLYLSHIAVVIEHQTEGVDFAIGIRLEVQGQLFGESVPVHKNALIAAGDHEIKITLGGD